MSRDWQISAELEAALLRAVQAGVFDDVPGLTDLAPAYRDRSPPSGDAPLSRRTLWDDVPGEVIVEGDRVVVAAGYLEGVEPEEFGFVVVEDPVADPAWAVAKLFRGGEERVDAALKGHVRLCERRAFACDLLAGFAAVPSPSGPPGSHPAPPSPTGAVLPASEAAAPQGRATGLGGRSPDESPATGSNSGEEEDGEELAEVVWHGDSWFSLGDGEVRHLGFGHLHAIVIASLKKQDRMITSELQKETNLEQPGGVLRRVKNG